MRGKINLDHSCSLSDFGRISPCSLFLILCALGPVIFVAKGIVFASEVEILIPMAAATIFARNPETHLILRQSGPGEASRVRVEKTGKLLDPVISMEGEEDTFLHFRLPLVPGKNSFTIVPGGQRIALNFQRIQAQLRQKSFGKDVFIFHKNDELPKSCQDCHDLKEIEIIEPMGLKKQISCATCHKTIVDKGAWKHGPTVNQQCLVCHQQSVKPWRVGFPKGSIDDICLTCHTGKKKWLSSKYRHGPMIGGCTLCHDPHGENNRYQLWAEGSMKLCVACHNDKKNLVSENKGNRLPYVHGIIFGMGCVACHDPHATANLFVLKKPINTLCTGCHQRLAGITQGHPVDRHPLSGPKDPRRPERQLACTGCHDPHGSSYQYLLIQTTLGGRLCRECHNR